jgi:hypothetical protein
MTQRILGYVMARNEWPLLGLAIVHAFASGIDHVVVVDHASSDGTVDGLRMLKSHWPNELTIIRLKETPYLQEATTAVVATALDAQSFDWVYVFDADEFILIGGELSLSSVLASVKNNCVAVRYEIDQWVAPADFDDLEPAEYQRIERVAVTADTAWSSGALRGREIENGQLNFFDVPFPSKVIVRGEYAHLLVAGAHSARSVRPASQARIDPTIMRSGHLPLLSRRRLDLKCEQGRALVEEHFPEDHGWQSQMLFRLRENGDLGSFWARHSIASESGLTASNGQSVRTRVDSSLSLALSRAAEQLLEILNAEQQSLSKGGRTETEGATWQLAIDAVRKQQVAYENLERLWKSAVELFEVGQRELAAVSEDLRKERDALHSQTEYLRAVEANLSESEESLAVERSRVFDLTKQLEKEMTRAFSAEKRVLELRQVRTEIMEIRASTSWRLGLAITSPVRKIRSLLKR